MNISYHTNPTDSRIFLFDISKDQFLKFNPPCKECLIQSMCIESTFVEYITSVDTNDLKLNSCERLKTFLNIDESFRNL